MAGGPRRGVEGLAGRQVRGPAQAIHAALAARLGFDLEHLEKHRERLVEAGVEAARGPARLPRVGSLKL